MNENEIENKKTIKKNSFIGFNTDIIDNITDYLFFNECAKTASINQSFNNAWEDKKKRIIDYTSSPLIKLSNQSFDLNVTAVLPLGNDLLIGTTDGLYIIKDGVLTKLNKKMDISVINLFPTDEKDTFFCVFDNTKEIGILAYEFKLNDEKNKIEKIKQHFDINTSTIENNIYSIVKLPSELIVLRMGKRIGNIFDFFDTPGYKTNILTKKGKNYSELCSFSFRSMHNDIGELLSLNDGSLAIIGFKGIEIWDLDSENKDSLKLDYTLQYPKAKGNRINICQLKNGTLIYAYGNQLVFCEKNNNKYEIKKVIETAGNISSLQALNHGDGGLFVLIYKENEVQVSIYNSSGKKIQTVDEEIGENDTIIFLPTHDGKKIHSLKYDETKIIITLFEFGNLSLTNEIKNMQMTKKFDISREEKKKELIPLTECLNKYIYYKPLEDHFSLIPGKKDLGKIIVVFDLRGEYGRMDEGKCLKNFMKIFPGIKINPNFAKVQNNKLYMELTTQQTKALSLFLQYEKIFQLINRHRNHIMYKRGNEEDQEAIEKWLEILEKTQLIYCSFCCEESEKIELLSVEEKFDSLICLLSTADEDYTKLLLDKILKYFLSNNDITTFENAVKNKKIPQEKSCL